MDEDFIFVRTPLGLIKISSTENGVTELSFCNADETPSVKMTGWNLECKKQLEHYFLGIRNKFELPLDLRGTEFQIRVWKELQNIPYGKTWSYKKLAEELDDPKVIRAAANANGQNPLAIIIPCHRVIGSNHELTGYAGGLWRKKWLLQKEQGILQTSLF